MDEEAIHTPYVIFYGKPHNCEFDTCRGVCSSAIDCRPMTDRERSLYVCECWHFKEWHDEKGCHAASCNCKMFRGKGDLNGKKT